MTEPSGILVVFDGHDGAGKSTLAARCAKLVGGIVVKPFGDTLGDHIAWLWGSGRFAEADSLARSSVERIVARGHTQPLVFDRHWVTMFSVLPETYWSSWHPLPRTVVCHASPEVTMARLVARGEPPLSYEHHDHFDRIYRSLGESCGALVLDTSTDNIDTCFASVRAFLELD